MLRWRREILLAAGAAVALSLGPARAEDTVKIGLIVPMTGGQASTGKQIDNAVKLYMQQHGDTVAGKKVEHAYLGLSGETATNAHNAYAGVIASQVLPGSPAARAGLKSGDIIVRIAGVGIHTFEDMTRVIDEHQPGEIVELNVLRKGKPHVVHITLGTRPGSTG